MGVRFWLGRFTLAFCGAFVLIAGAHLARGRTLAHALTEGVLWAMISSIVFLASRLYHSRKGRYCALCKDMPEPR